MKAKYLFALVIMTFFLASCGIFPGMQNVDVSRIPIENEEPTMTSHPIVKPITASLLMKEYRKPYVYHIAAQDILSIMILNNPELNLPNQLIAANNQTSQQSSGAAGYIVNDQGDIYFPLIGILHVSGKTVDEIRQLMIRKLSYYIRKPQVFIRIADFRAKKVYVMGEVQKAGFLPLTDQPLSITAALNMAGSLDPNTSDPRHIYVIRGSLARPKIYWLNASTPIALLLGERFQLEDNDVMVVSTAATTRWSRFLNQLLPTLQTIWYTKAITGK